MKLRSSILIPNRCAQCGTKFYRIQNVAYGWQIDNKKFCSYHCMREWERPILEREAAKMHKKFAKAEEEVQA